MRREELTLPRWPAALDGLRVGVMTDLHSGMPHAGLDAIERAADTLAAERPDVVCLLGDFIDRRALFARPVNADALAMRLAPLAAAPRGLYAVLGNHDWYAGARRIGDALEGAGVMVLEDSAAPAGDGGLWVAGTGDFRVRGARVERALMPVPEDAPVLLLSHDPDAFPDVPARVEPDAVRPHPRRPGRGAAGAAAVHSLPLRRALCGGPRRGGRPAPLRVVGRRHERAAGALPAPARGGQSDAARPQLSSVSTCSPVIPTAGFVATSSVGPWRWSAHSWQVSSCASSIQASGRSGPA